MLVAVFLGYINQYWLGVLMVFVVLCPGAPKGSEDRVTALSLIKKSVSVSISILAARQQCQKSCHLG